MSTSFFLHGTLLIVQDDQAGLASELGCFVGCCQRVRITSLDHHRREDCPASRVQTVQHSFVVLRIVASDKENLVHA